jgi:hypothetical protein
MILKENISAIILAADSITTSPNGTKPRCLHQTVGFSSVLERQFKILSLFGIKSNNIGLVIGSKGLWQDIENLKLLKNLTKNIFVNENNLITNSTDSLKLAIDGMKTDNDFLVIYGDTVFDLDHLEMVTKNMETTNLLCRKAFSISEKGLIIKKKTNKYFIPNKSEYNGTFPWDIFSGIIFLENSVKKLFKQNFETCKKDNVVSSLLSLNPTKPITVCDMHEKLSGDWGVSHTPIDLNGGSYARLRKKLVVLKEARGEGFEKLIREYQWIENLPENLKSFFPTVVNSGSDSNSSFYEMPWYDLPNIRKNIIIGKYDTGDVFSIVKDVLDFMINNFYKVKVGIPEIDFIKTRHFDRVYYRLFEVFDSSNEYKKIIKSETVTINNILYDNIPKLFTELVKKKDLIEILSPKDLVMIHGDLHFQNILIDDTNNSFILADPRGEIEGSDHYYDMGKLWHSFNGLYDLIHTNQFTMNIEQSDNSVLVVLDFNDKKALKLYNNLKELTTEHIKSLDLFKSDSNHMTKILFNEAMHFCSVMTFHLDRYRDENRSMAMYFMGVKLLNEFMNLPDVQNSKIHSSCFSFETEQEFINLLNNNN